MGEAAHGVLEGGERLLVTPEVAQGLGARGRRHLVVGEAAHGLFEAGQRLLVTPEVAQGFGAHTHCWRIRAASVLNCVKEAPCPLEKPGPAGEVGDGRQGLNEILRPAALALTVDQPYQCLLGAT